MERNDLPKVSVIMPVYNTEQYVIKAINSLLNQTYKNIEIIVVDDGSTDNSYNKLVDCFHDNSIVKIYKKENGGASTARNLGLEKVTGELITFLDSDDSFEPDAINISVEAMKSEESDIVVPCVFNEISIDGKITEKELFTCDFTSIDASEFATRFLIQQGTAWRCSSVLYKSDVIKTNTIRFYEGVTAEDFIFNLSYYKYINKASIIRQPTLNVQKREGSVTATYRESSLDLFLLLDDVANDYLLSLGYSEEMARKIVNQLLLRNVVVFFVKTIKAKYKQMGVFNTSKIVKQKFCEIERIRIALKTSNNRDMYFTTKSKRRFAVLILYLLKAGLFRIAGICAALG